MLPESGFLLSMVPKWQHRHTSNFQWVKKRFPMYVENLPKIKPHSGKKNQEVERQ
jgi:hypothetical protein